LQSSSLQSIGNIQKTGLPTSKALLKPFFSNTSRAEGQERVLVYVTVRGQNEKNQIEKK
jgi:hypothetical protein